MDTKPRYHRVLLKLSGETLCSPGGSGVDPAAAAVVADEIAPLLKMGVQVAIVIGGGNFIRGAQLVGADSGGRIARATADHMGMLATAINALALRDVLESSGLPACVLSAIAMSGVCEGFDRRRAIEHLEAGRIVILAAGTGSPFFTTDTCASLRAVELDADVLLKATKVDGVYDADPVTNPNAKRYDTLTYQQVLADRLGVMDLTAISMCMENHMPVIVFKMADAGNLARAVCGENVGTRVTA
jgi:uridylate kinase